MFRRSGIGATRPYPRPAPEPRIIERSAEAARKAMRPQSLLFSRSAGWTPSKAKAWAKSHGYKYGKVDVTDQYVRLRQSDPKGSKNFRTIPFGDGIRAVVAREKGSTGMTRKTAVAAKRRKRHKKAAPAPKRRHRRRAHKARAVATRRRRRKVRVEAKVATRRRRRRVAAPVVQTRRRRHKARASTTVRAWHGSKRRHATAAKKGWSRRKKRKSSTRRRRRVHAVATPVVATRRRRVRAAAPVVQTSRRRRRKVHAATPVVQARRHRRRHMHAGRGGGGMGPTEMALGVLLGGVGYVAADALDRFLATYDPSSTEAPPKDKFTSTGTGSLANTLNVATRPGLVRLGAGVVAVAAPAAGAYFVRDRTAKAAFEGLAMGAGINLFKTLFNSFLMPMLVGKDADLKKNVIARLYPSEVAAKINLESMKGADGKTPPGPYNASGVLSGPDVGPFALGGDSPYADAAQALRQQAGVQEQFPSMQNTWGTGGPGSDYPTAAQAMGTGDPYQPGPPPGPGPGPQATPHKDPACGCIGDDIGTMYAGLLGDQRPEEPLYTIPNQ